MAARVGSGWLRLRKLASIGTTPVLARALLRHRVAAGVEHRSVLTLLSSCATVVDIGANRGQFALAARQCHPAASLEAFEPLPAPADVFQQVFVDAPDVRLHRTAIGPQRTQATMHVSARDDSSSVLPITATQAALFSGTEEAGLATIEIGPLDQFLEPARIHRPALLKIDVQGFELQALQGCESLLDQFTWLYVECSFIELYEGQALADDVIAWLRERGFAVQGAYNVDYDTNGRAIQADFLFGC